MRLIKPEELKSPYGGRFAWYYYEPEVGDVIEREHPFTRVVATYDDFGEKRADERWRPGAWLVEDCDTYTGYHAEGGCRLEVHAIAAPKGFPRRICYTRQFTTPDGKKLKRSGLITHSITKFRKVCEGGVGFEIEKMPDCPPLMEKIGVPA